MTSATYKYSLKADSGYKSDQSGKITPERHGVVCAALDGGLSDDLLLLRAAPDLLAALQGVLRVADRATDEFYAARAAIAKATSISN
jgi:hypothetical protein